MFDSGIHHQDLGVPGPSKLNVEKTPVFNSGTKTAQLLQVKTSSNEFCRKIYDKVEVESLTEL